jgi:hypothetical protein
VRNQARQVVVVVVVVVMVLVVVKFMWKGIVHYKFYQGRFSQH